MGCLWCGKYSRQCKMMPSGLPEFISPSIAVTGMKCSYGKIFSPFTEISGTEPAGPLIWTHWKFYKGFRGEARSRKPGQPGQPGSYEEALKLLPTHATTVRFRLQRLLAVRKNVIGSDLLFALSAIQSG